MDRFRRTGGFLWVGSGIALQALVLMNGTSTVGIVTWLLIGDIVVLSVLAAVAPLGCAAIVAGHHRAGLQLPAR